MHAWEAIQKSIDYIENNLAEEIKIETLSNVASLSPYYFQRLFGRLIKKPVNEYVKLRRMAKASEDLKNKNKRIFDIALDYGFCDHANFTRAFKGTYGITPEEYRNHPVILNQFVKPDLLLNYVMVEEDIPLITEGMVVEVTRRNLDERRTFIGIKYEVPVSELANGKTTGIAMAGGIWDDFHRQKPGIPHILVNGNEFGVLYMGENTGDGCCIYMVGAEVTENTMTEEYGSYTLPRGEYIVCCFRAENFAELVGSAVFKASSFMKGWMKKHNLTCGEFVTEMYYDTNTEVNYMELWLTLRQPQVIQKKEDYWNKYDGTKEPSIEAISAYVNSPLWGQLCNYVEEQYKMIKPIYEYSRCSMQQGWNVKYKKAGRTLCTLYPMEGYFIALIVIGERERLEMELALTFFTKYLVQLYYDTKCGMGQKWLMINVMDEAILEDVKECIAIRYDIKKKKPWR